MPYPGAGTGEHVHISLNSTTLSPSELQERGTHFWAEVLAHMEALCAFSLPHMASEQNFLKVELLLYESLFLLWI